MWRSTYPIMGNHDLCTGTWNGSESASDGHGLLFRQLLRDTDIWGWDHAWGYPINSFPWVTFSLGLVTQACFAVALLAKTTGSFLCLAVTSCCSQSQPLYFVADATCIIHLCLCWSTSKEVTGLTHLWPVPSSLKCLQVAVAEWARRQRWKICKQFWMPSCWMWYRLTN